MGKKLTILHSNDLHGDFLAEKIDEKLVGGVSLLSGYIRREREINDSLLYVIAGDMFRGSIIDSEYKGLSTIEIMNFLGPDVVTVGNHETDYGIAHLLFLEKCAKFPIINANLYIKSNHQRLFSPFKVVYINGLRVMFIGVLTEEVLNQTKGEELIGAFVDIWEARKEIGVIIDNYKTTSIDLTVLLTHIGFEEDKKLAAILDPEWGVDMIIGGHSHTSLSEPAIVNGIPIVQAYTGTDQIGRFDIDFDDKNKLIGYTWQCIPINEKTCPFDPIMEELLGVYKDETDKKYQRIITTFRRPLSHPQRNMETELGNLIADLLQVDSSFDIMLFGSGAIRKKQLGPIVRYQDLKECLPYDEAVVMLEVTGKQFKHMIKHMLRDECYDDGHTEFYQVSKGVHIVYNRLTKVLEVCQLNGKDIYDEKIIKIGLTAGYHLDGFSKFFDVPIEEVYANKKPKTVITSCNAIFEELLSASTNFDSHLEDRILIKNRKL
jgi:5'-nucleotidase/UDP-sugar diphosphatase